MTTNQLDAIQLEDALFDLKKAQERLALIQENRALRERNAELERWYNEYCDSGAKRLSSDLDFALAVYRSACSEA